MNQQDEATVRRVQSRIDWLRNEIARLETTIDVIRSLPPDVPATAMVIREEQAPRVPVQHEGTSDASVSLEPPLVAATSEGFVSLRGKTRRDAIIAVLKHTNRPMRVGEVLDKLRNGGHSVPDDRRSAHNSIFGSLKNFEGDYFKRVGNAEWTLADQDMIAITPSAPRLTHSEQRMNFDHS
jgi:hypothetical protein